MRSFVRGVGVGLACLVLAGGARAQTDQEAPGSEAGLPPEGTQLVFVNTQAILPRAPGADEAQAKFQEELEGYETELRSLASEIDSLVTAYRRQESLLDGPAKEQKQQEILEKQRAAQVRQTELEQRSEQRRSELLKPILDEIRDVIEAIRAERRYAIVFDVAESGVVAADPSLDITTAVLERMGVDPNATASATPNR